MQKIVYLFELDSTRNSDEEIAIGQRALYDEIVYNGHVVVLTFNQLVDSRGFFSLLRNENYYDSIIELFENGAIRISQYGDTRTIVQYMLNSLSYERSFIFSGWPLKSTQKRLLAMIRRSLVYSDLAEISGYIKGEMSDEKLLDLFVELSDEDELCCTENSIGDCRLILENLYYLLKTVLILSPMEQIYIRPKESAEIYEEADKTDGSRIELYAESKMDLPGFIHNALELELADSENEDIWKSAVNIIKSIKELDGIPYGKPKKIFDFDETNGSKDRSDYHWAIRELYKKYKRDSRDESEKGRKPYEYAEAIVDICYNYQMEYSICNVSRHYSIGEFESGKNHGGSSFKSDFFLRLRNCWDVAGGQFLEEETDRFDEFVKPKKFPDFSVAVRMWGYKNGVYKPDSDIKTNSSYIEEQKKNGKNEEDRENIVRRYEYELEREQKEYRRNVRGALLKGLSFSIWSAVVACFIELVFWLIQTLFDNEFDINTLLSSVAETLLFLIISEAVTTILSKHCDFVVSLSDALGNARYLFKDAQ